jgi:hypothetical protein
MSRRRSVAQAERVPGALPDYQCVRIGDVWHATQEQALPPPISNGGAWTICAVWAPFTRGYERRRPDCTHCLRACHKDEGTRVEPVAPPSMPPPPRQEPKPKLAETPPPPVVQLAPAAKPPVASDALRESRAVEEADFNARLRALMTTTRKGRR